MLSYNRKQSGNSLVELMVGMTLGLASIAAMASLVGHGIALNSALLAKSRLDEEVYAVLTVIGQTLSRAGYQANTSLMVDALDTFDNPFLHTLRVTEFTSEPSDSCIVFAYDRNKNGLLDTIDTNENYGFRLRDNAVEIRVNGFECDQKGWHDLTDPSVINVTQLKFVIDKNTAYGITQSRVTIFLQARLENHPDISRYVSTGFSIKNYE